MTSLKDKIKNLSKKPGVYIFKDKDGKIVYIGKALSLKDRVASYFRQKHQDAKTNELVKKVSDLQTIEVNSEFEALLLEAKLIKQHRPKYNIRSRDGKSYLYIVIGKRPPNRIYPSRRPEVEEKLLAWYGPFPSSRDVKEVLRTVRRIFPFRSCTNLPSSPCLYYHLKLCPGVCAFPNGNYPKVVGQIKQMLSGKTSTLIRELEKEMNLLAKQNKFEEAEKIKHKVDALTRLTQGWKNVPEEKREIKKTIEEIKKTLVKYGGLNLIALSKIEGYDVSNLSSQVIVGSMVAFVNGEPDKSQYRKFNLKYNLSFQDDPEGIKHIVRRRLNHAEWILPQLMLIDGGKTQISAAFSALKEKNLENQIALIGLTKEEEILIVPRIINHTIRSWERINLPRDSLVLKLFQYIRDESHRFAQKYYKLLHQKKVKI